MAIGRQNAWARSLGTRMHGMIQNMAVLAAYRSEFTMELGISSVIRTDAL